jgi:hypothetical protein
MLRYLLQFQIFELNSILKEVNNIFLVDKLRNHMLN